MENSKDLYDKLIHFELVKSDKNAKVKKYVAGLAVMSSFYYSLWLAIGLILGYFISKFFTKFFVENGKVNMVFIDCGKWKIHLHHWIMGLLFLLFIWFIDYLYLPKFFLGIVLGIIAHDIYDFNDWREILVKKEAIK